MNIEPLEARIAPAVIISPIDPKIASYTDIDGDKVTIKVSTGAFNNSVFTTMTKPLGDQLLLINLSAGGFDDAHLTISVVKALGGDGLANIGAINSTGHDLGAVVIPGDLGQIDAGDAIPDGGLKSLTVRSMGLFGLATQLVTGDLTSTIVGRLGALKTTSDFKDAFLFVSAGGVGSVTIGGSLIGGAGIFQGSLRINGDIGPINIARDLIGGGSFSGQIIAIGGNIASVTIGGSLLGSTGADGGSISNGGTMGPVRIAGDVVGNFGAGSGKIFANGKISSLSIGGSLLGGEGPGSGVVQGNADIGPVTIGGNLKGGGNGAGEITAGGKITSVTIGGSLLGGPGPNSGLIVSDSDIGPVKIGFDVKGGAGDESGKIDASGKLASVSIGGSLLGGAGRYDTNVVNLITHSGQVFSGGDLGLVRIGGDLLGGSGFNSASIFSRGAIAGVSIGGSLLGGTQEDTAVISTLTARPMGAVTIGHDLVGGAGRDSARISHAGTLAGVTIGGSLLGGVGDGSGAIFSSFGAPATAFVKIGHDLAGGIGFGSGTISGSKVVTIGGSLIGGTGNFSGQITAFGKDIDAISIGHDLLGGSIPGQSAALDGSGYIESDQRIGSIFIGGSIISGTDGSGGVEGLTKNASIRAGRDIGSLTVVGGLIGNVTPNGDSPVIISAGGRVGNVTGLGPSEVAIGKLSVGGRVEWAKVLAGYNLALSPVNADAQIGSVTVGADWIASSIVAGAVNLGTDNAPGGTLLAADNVNFGDIHDAKIPEATDNLAVDSRIASIVIAGQVFGTPESLRANDAFGFVAEEIGALKVGARTFTLQPGESNDGFTIARRSDNVLDDAMLHEVDALFGFTLPVGVAPLLVNASTVTYADADGDRVTVKFSKPVLTPANVNTIFTFSTTLIGNVTPVLQQLEKIDVGSLQSHGLGITITVAPGGKGDGLAHVGGIYSIAYDLGAIVVPGDLHQILSGSGDATRPGLASLDVRTLGRLGSDANAPGGQQSVLVTGKLGALKVRQDIAGTPVQVTGAIGPISIGGSLLGGDSNTSGRISATGAIGAVKIGQHLQGGFGQGSGAIVGSGATGIASLSVGGSLLGAGGSGSGATFGGVTGFVAVGHNVRGGTNGNAGTIGVENGGTVTVGGSIVGGSGGFGARIVSDSAIGAVKVAHNVVGGVAERTARIEGFAIASVTIGGSLLGGFGATSGSVTSESGGNLGPVKIGHDVLGGEGADSGKIDSGAKLVSVSIGGSLLGGDGPGSGRIESAAETTLVTIGQNVRGGVGSDSGTVFAQGRLSAVTPGGSLIGGSGPRSGEISAGAGMGGVKIGRDVHGGSSVGESGSIFARGGNLTSVSIGGSLLGGAGFDSGEIFTTGDAGAVKIGGDVIGGTITASGLVTVRGQLTSLSIGGSLFGGASDSTGVISGDDIGAVKIGRNLIGGSIAGTMANLSRTGFIEGDRIASVSIGGSIVAGTDDSTAGELFRNASIRARDDLGAVAVRGSLIGHSGPQGFSPVILSARDQAGLAPGATLDLAIKSLSIGGRVQHAQILAGYDDDANDALNGNASIGAVSVGGDWFASDLVAGAQDDASAARTDPFGDADDQPGPLSTLIARIARIAIGGVVAGTATAGDHFGFVAEQIGSFKSFGFTAALTPGLNVLELSLTTGDVTLREVP